MLRILWEKQDRKAANYEQTVGEVATKQEASGTHGATGMPAFNMAS